MLDSCPSSTAWSEQSLEAAATGDVRPEGVKPVGVRHSSDNITASNTTPTQPTCIEFPKAGGWVGATSSRGTLAAAAKFV